ncbi:putative transcription initiation factor tfiid subunit 11 [Erysiphe neolycopersici]|uniref:Putative transcription initiation factor tfiid subunit 11 n=1 Tax=Erysiphe neolycopersici TaxID=212602 RepID=A0A420HWR5_9PEZI|nr:putative transcription initiation factor tfiid subunit 11 [Erysiphe neolycopersici]
MASPPNTNSLNFSTVSPSNSVFQQPIPHIAKRRQSDNPPSLPANKRRKASMVPLNFSSIAHPLRQTSFPTERTSQSPMGRSRSPSVDRMSIVSGSAAAYKKKKIRTGKSKDVESTPVSGVFLAPDTCKGTAERVINDVNLDEEEEEMNQELAVNATENSKEERLKEERRRHLLTRAFNKEQWQRYEAWRSSKLSDSVIVNQTLSQSAPQQVILAVRSVAKVFAGDMIERARKVQTEWLEISGENPGFSFIKTEDNSILDQKGKEKRRGPLMPDHLREAYRRHLLTDTALVGQLGLWQLQQQSGVERFGARIGGKQLFK